MMRRTPISTRTDTLFPYTPLFRSFLVQAEAHRLGDLQQLFLRNGADQAVGHVRVLPHEAGVRAVAREGEAGLPSLAARAHRQRDVLAVVVAVVELGGRRAAGAGQDVLADEAEAEAFQVQIGRAAGRERVCQYV